MSCATTLSAIGVVLVICVAVVVYALWPRAEDDDEELLLQMIEKDMQSRKDSK